MNERDQHRWFRFTASVVSLLAMAVAAPVGLLAASRSRFGSSNPLAGMDPPSGWGFGSVADAVSGPIANQAVADGIIRLSLCVAWAATATIVVTTIVEVLHALRHRGIALPDIRGLGWAQIIARSIAIGLLAVVPAVAPTASLAATIGESRAATPADGSTAATLVRAHTAGARTAATDDTPVVDPLSAQPTTIDWAAVDTTHVVAAGESIYAIATNLAGGDPSRVIEIADAIIDANLGTVMPGGQTFTNPAYIEVGWKLHIPNISTRVPAAPSAQPGDYTVEPGDTLWGIANDHLGDPTAWGKIWRRNANRTMVDGQQFTDPNLIVPGWKLELTDAEASMTPTPQRTSTPNASTTSPSTSTTNTSTTSTSTTSTMPATGAVGGYAGERPPVEAPSASAPVRLEHAALLAAGLLALVGVRRRQRLRSAPPRHRVPEPPADVALFERRLRTVDASERAVRIDVACRAAARSLIGTGSQIGWIEAAADGAVSLRLTAPATLPAPWIGHEQQWRLAGGVPIEILADDARQVGQPCVALVQLGVTASGAEVIVDLEACGVLAVTAPDAQADQVVTAIAAGLASSLFAEVAHLVAVSLPEPALLGHRNAHIVESADAALELAGTLAGTTAINDRTSFELRSLRTGGEMWEPAIVLLQSKDDGAVVGASELLVDAGHGLAVVVADGQRLIAQPQAQLAVGEDGWHFTAFGSSLDVAPIGVDGGDLEAIAALLDETERPLESLDHHLQHTSRDAATGAAADAPTEITVYEPRPHQIVVGLLGSVEVHARTGEAGNFERSKTVELLAWLCTHRDRPTRSGARTALWELDVRDATFANVVSEARRALARLVAPPNGEEWVGRTLTEQLPLHDQVVTDADLVADRLGHARVQPPAQALETLRPAVEMVRDMPFTASNYLWPDAEGITSNLVLLAISATAEFAGHALSLGDVDGVFWATGKGLRVLPGHEELIALRMQAHARAGDLAGVRNEWESYERVLAADAWSDGEPAPKLLALRHQLLTTAPN